MDDCHDNGCKLLDGFGLLVQLALAITALMTLVFKRWHERPQRPVRIWTLDVSKQFVGAGTIHMMNIGVSYLAGRPAKGPQTNICVWYFLNVAVDTTLGILVLWFWLWALQQMLRAYGFRHIRSGDYGPPPLINMTKAWAQQTLVFVLAESLMKLCTYTIFQHLPILFSIGAWLLAWTEDDYHYQVIFVMLVFPLVMNAIQFWVIDTILKVQPTPKHLGEGRQSSVSDYEQTYRWEQNPRCAATYQGERTPLLIPNHRC